MTDEIVFKPTKLREHKSGVRFICFGSNDLGVSEAGGLECAWSCEKTYDSDHGCDILRFSWKFNMDELKKRGIDRLSGYIIVKPSYEANSKLTNCFNKKRVSVDMNNSNQIIQEIIRTKYWLRGYCAEFEYSLTPYYSEKLSCHCNRMILPSEQNTTVLVVGGRKISVDKWFLSCHSQYFENLFSLNDTNGNVDEIAIEDISYNDFKLLLDTISPKPVFPNDETVEKLLELATRFKISFVFYQCKHHLLHISKLENEKKKSIGEKYKMSDLLEKSIREIDTIEKAKKWKLTPEYSKLFDNTKLKVLEAFFKF